MTTNHKTQTLNTSNDSIETPKATNPINAITGKAYFGDKGKRLQETARFQGYSSNDWATMKQWNSAKQTIAKGEKGTLILHFEKPLSEDGEPQAKRSFVFNRCQLESFQAIDCGDKPF